MPHFDQSLNARYDIPTGIPRLGTDALLAQAKVKDLIALNSTVNSHTTTLSSHTGTLSSHTSTLSSHEARLDALEGNSGVLDILRYGAVPGGAAGTEAANDAAFLAALAAARTQVALHSFSAAAIYVPPGVFRINNTIELLSGDDRISIYGTGCFSSVIITPNPDIDIIRLSGGVTSTGVVEASVSGLKLAYIGTERNPASMAEPDLRRRPALLRCNNVTDFSARDLALEGGYNGLVFNRAARAHISNLQVWSRSSLYEAHAGVIISSDSTMPGSSTRIFMENCDVQPRGSNITTCYTHGILIESVDGLQANIGHLIGCRNDMTVSPDGTANRNTIGGVHISDYYFDTAEIFNLLFEGAATTEYGRIFLDSCRFRDAGTDGIRINTTAGTTIDVLQISGGAIDLAGRLGLACSVPVESLLIEGTEFKDNNATNIASGGDMVLRGTKVSIEATVKGGGPVGTAVILGSDLTSGTVEIDTSQSTATTLFNDSSSGVQRKPAEIEAEVYTPGLYSILNVTSATLNGAQYFRLGSVVEVVGSIAIHPTAVGDTELQIGIPIPCDFSSSSQAAGVVTSETEFGRVEASVADNRLTLLFDAVTASNHTLAFTASYRLLSAE